MEPRDSLSRRSFLLGASGAAGAGVVTGLLGAPRRARASGHKKLKLVEGLTLRPPSNSSFVEAIIKAKKFDHKHGIDLNIDRYARLGAMYADFASGKHPVALSPAFYNAANFYVKGIPIQYTFTYTTANQAIMSKNPNIKSIADLKGKRLAATTGSGFYGMTVLALRRNGLNPRKDLQLMNASPPAVRTQLEVGKVDAGIVWASNVPHLLLKGFHIVGDINADIRSHLNMKPNAPIWYLGNYAYKKWLDEDPDRILALLRAYQDAVRFWNEHTKEAAKIVSKLTKISEEILLYTVEKKLLVLKIVPAIQEKENIKKSLQGFIDVGFLKKMPDDGIFYKWPQLKG